MLPATKVRQSNKKPWVLTLARVAVSVGALLFVLSRVDLAVMGAAMRGLSPLWAALTILAVLASIVVSTWKWSILLNVRGYSLPFLRLFRHYMVGLFFNNFLPTSVGGDVVRAIETGQDIDDMPEGAASVLAERLIAAVALGTTAAVGLLFAPASMQATVAVAIVLIVSIGLVALFLAPSRTSKMMASAMGGRFSSAANWVSSAVTALRKTLRSGRAVFSVFLLSILFQILVATVNYAIFQALDHPVGIGSCIVYTSIISAVTMVPISISGHGVREAGYAYFFGLAGVPAGVAVAASLLFFVVVALTTLPGGLLFAVGRKSE